MATPGQMPVTFWTMAASSSFSRKLRAAPGQGNTLKRVPELPYPHEGVSTLNCFIAAMTPSIVTPCSCKRFSISGLTYSPFLPIVGFCAGIGLLSRRTFHKRKQGAPLHQAQEREALKTAPAGYASVCILIEMKNFLKNWWKTCSHLGFTD